MNKEPQHSLPAGNSEPSKELVKVESTASADASSDHEQGTVTSPINFEKALGSIYEELSDEDKARLSYALDQDEKLRSLFASMTSADFGGMIGGLSEEEFEAQAQPYRDLIEGVLADQAGATTDQRNPEVTADTDNAPGSELAVIEDDEDGLDGEKVGVGANAFAAKTRIGAWLNDRKQKSEAKRAERRREYAQELLAQGMDPAEVRNMVNERESKRSRRNRILLGAGALTAAAIAAGSYWYFIGRHNGTGTGNGGGANHEGASDQFNMPKAGNGQDIISENQLHDYFNMPNPMENAKGNNLTGGNEALANMDKAGAVANLENAFRGDTHMTAMWASQLGIPGAPEMPSLEVLRNDPGAANAYNIRVNDWADTLNNDVRLRADVTNQLMEKVNSGALGDKITLNPGYMSTGRNNAPEGTQGIIFGAESGEVFLDTEVWKSDVPAVELVIDGHTYLWEPGCDQLAYQGPAIQQPVGTPQGGGTTPNSPFTPNNPTNPGTPSTPDTPSTPSTPDTPSTPEEPETPVNPPVEEEPPVVPPKDPTEDINVNEDLPEEVRMGDVRMGSGDPQTEQEVTTPADTYTQPADDDNDESLAPGAQPSSPAQPTPSQQTGSSTGSAGGGQSGTTTESVGEN